MEISTLIFIAFSLTVAYLIVIGIITWGWFNIKYESELDLNDREKIAVSIVIAVRNESENITPLLNQLTNQNYDPNYYEIIIVNDGSTDDTCAITEDFIASNNAQNIKLIHSDQEGKKNAIRKGVEKSAYDFILTTDGDCSINEKWIASIVYYYKSTNKKVIIGPVVYKKTSSFMKNLFTIDFASLVASGAGSVGAGLPLMGNGANLAFEKSIFDEYDDKSNKFKSGDDVFLIHHASKKFGHNSVGFIKNKNALVETSAPQNIKSFFEQRIRWGSKARGYTLIWPILVSSIVLLYNTALLIVLASSLIYSWMLLVYVLIVTVKYMIDAPLVVSYLRFSGRSNIRGLMLVFEFVYPLYIFVSAILSFTTKYTWKQRKKLN